MKAFGPGAPQRVEGTPGFRAPVGFPHLSSSFYREGRGGSGGSAPTPRNPDSIASEGLSPAAPGVKACLPVQETQEMRAQSLVRKMPWRRHGHPLQYSRLENPRDRGAWRATVHGVTKSETRLSN